MTRSGAATVMTVAVVAALVVGGCYLLGRTHPPRATPVTGDVVGPDTGESVSDYLARARQTLTAVPTDDAMPRWALISLRDPLTDGQVAPVVSPVSLSQVVLHVAIPGVRTPVTVEPAGVSAIGTARDRAIGELMTRNDPDPDGSRDQRIAAVTISRLRSGCACVIALVVRGSPDRLRTVAADPRVRAVEVLPADAAGGLFAVRTLLPEDTSSTGPAADTATVPPP
ncbi:hypothetical protein [Williamsia sterculiae]|uniref:Uncharacterized protein n=1 Tax=Williamsia sterculiae TaxID=1344003 RepID=A0A1N7H6D9_9NOCA|nr:hypothetical protein [Williamsia sterculiae]SIS20425.1 hypothetical protein SAMN05445060_3604 [Williamsia sterculiae]